MLVLKTIGQVAKNIFEFFLAGHFCIWRHLLRRTLVRLDKYGEGGK